MIKTIIKILVVEDEPLQVILLEESLEKDALAVYELRVVDRLQDALETLGQLSFDVILLDLGLPDSFGLETFTRLHHTFPETPKIILSGYADEYLALQAVQAGAQDYLVKGPQSWSILARAIRYSIERQRAQDRLLRSERQLQALVTSLDDIVFEVDENGTYLNLWTANEDLLFAPREQVIGQRFDQIFGEQDSREFYAALERVLQSCVPETLEYPVELPGGVRWFSAHYNPIQTGVDACRSVAILVRDITERKQAERDLLEKLRLQEQLEKTASTVPGMLHTFKMNPDGRFSMPYASPAIGDIYGLHSEDVAQDVSAIWAIIDPKDLSQVEASIAASASSMHPWRQEFRLNHPQKGQRWLEGHSTPVRAEDGSLLWHGIIQDVTERKRTEALIVAQRDLARAIGNFDTLEAGYRLCLDTVLSLSGLDSGGIYLLGPGQHGLDLIYHQGLGDAFIQDVSHFAIDSANVQMILPGKSIYFEASDLQKNLKNRVEGLQSLATVPILYQERVIGCLNLASHTLAQVPEYSRRVLETLAVEVGNFAVYLRSQQALHASEEQYRSLAEASDALIVMLDRDVRVVYLNDKAAQVQRVQPAQVVGRTLYDMLPLEIADRYQEWVQVVFASNQGQVRETFYPPNWYRTSLLPIRDTSGNAIMVLLTAADITALKIAQQELLELNQSLEQRVVERTAELQRSRDELSMAYAIVEKASRAKDDFLANMSHELRTPLNGILGASEILLAGLRGALDEPQKKLVLLIESSGRHLLSLINDILDLSKIEAGRLDLHPELVQLNDVCQSSLAFVKEPANKKGQSIAFIPDPLVTSILADPLRLKQILVNLLNNAVKFTPPQGKISLQVQAHAAKNCIDLSVSDTGIGIAEDDLQRLFNPFTQVDSSLTRQYEGTGLGLALVKRLVDLHGGTVQVTSFVGQGSRFVVSLPWQHNSTTQEARATSQFALPVGPVQAAPLPAGQGIVLLAEDTYTNLLMVGDYLEGMGYQMVYAHTGQEALAKAEEYKPNIILMDIQMPEMDGLTAIRRLRAMPAFAVTPIVALTALAMPGDRERCLEAGANEYVGKPVRLKQLAELIQKLLSQV